MRNTSIDWEKLAKENPYWAVLTEDRFKATMSPETLKSFYKSGERDVEGFISIIRQSFPDFSPQCETAIDFGCGVGRLLFPIAQTSSRAIGVDVSPSMRAIAAEYAKTAQIDNVEFAASAEDLVSKGVKADWVNSYIVLQHIEPRTGYFIVNDLLQCVKPGGVASLHIPFFKTSDRADYFNDRVMYFKNDYYENRSVFIDRDNYQNADIQMYDYDANTVLAIFHKNQMTQIHLYHDGSTTGIHAFHVVGRRSA